PQSWRALARLRGCPGSVLATGPVRTREALLRAKVRCVMTMGPGRAACLVLAGALASRASAQTIAPADFLPLGAGAQWLYERGSGSGPTQVRLNVVDVNQADSGTRYLVEVPF